MKTAVLSPTWKLCLVTNRWLNQGAILVFLSVLLTGCSLIPQQTAEDDYDWAFAGRMSISDGQQASSFNVDWQQTGGHFDIELYGPFGQGRTQISGSPEQVILTQGNESWVASDLSQLALELTNMQLPLDYLQYWVRALPEPNTEAVQQRNSDGQVIFIQQAGWVVDISEYHAAVGTLPRKLTFSRENSRGRLVIRDWTLLQ